ncbi:hypothetical protein BGZ70_006380, partial [Mortierella alpina]
MAGRPVTTKKLRKALADFWGDTHEIPSVQTIRKLLRDSGLKYDLASKTKNFIDTPDIKLKRRLYLKQRYDAKYEGALFSWFSDGMVVLRKNKGKRYCIIYAGCEDGWVGEPWVWQADCDTADYHQNMNADIFENYMKALCKWCKNKYGDRKVVFCMDNARYHRREHQGDNAVSGMDPSVEIRTIDDYLEQKYGM